MTRPKKTKTPQGVQAEGAFNTTNSKGIFTYPGEVFKRRVWIAQYSLENSRQSHASAGRLISEIMCCIGLVLLRIMEVWL